MEGGAYHVNCIGDSGGHKIEYGGNPKVTVLRRKCRSRSDLPSFKTKGCSVIGNIR